jgi:ribonucleoside-diphosphate reductase subunit M2
MSDGKFIDILDEDDDDMAFLPIKRPTLHKKYIQQRDLRWVPKLSDLAEDRHSFVHDCGKKIRFMVERINGFFVFADGMVCENLSNNFQKDTSFWKECTHFYAEQNAIEVIHGHTYSIMNEILVPDKRKRDKILNYRKNSPATKRIADFMNKYMSRDYPLLTRVLAFACVEGIIFNSAFAAIYWIKKKNLLPGFTKMNEYIARDERLHTEFAVTLMVMMTLTERYEACHSIEEVVREAVEVNEQFINEIIPEGLVGLSRVDLIDYTKCTADALLKSIDAPEIYSVQNPFDWMAVISLPNKTNFFEGHVTEYTMAEDEEEFTFDENVTF